MTLLATWLWQGIAVAAATAVLLALARNVGAATRHAVWWASLAAVVLLPLVPFAGRAVVPASAERGASSAPADGAVALPAAPGELLVALATISAVITLIALIRIGFSVRTIARLRARSAPFDARRAARLSMWNAARTERRDPELRISTDVRTASALGLGRPVILLSPAVLALDDDSLDAVVMHEHAHLARYDDWTQLLQATVSALLALHPAVWFIGRRIRLEREAACDDYVIARGAAAREYARSLVELADPARTQPWGSVAIPGVTRSRSELRQRVHRLLDPSRRRDVRLAWPVFVTSIAFIALGLGAAAQTPALVVFVEGHVPAPPVAALTRVARYVAAPSPVVSAVAIPAQPRPIPSAALPPSPAPSVEPQALPSVAPPPAPPAATVHGPLEPLPVSRRVASLELGMVSTPHVPAADAEKATNSTPSVAEPWMTLARSVTSAGKATGGGAKAAGTSIGRFFSRAGKAIATSR